MLEARTDHNQRRRAGRPLSQQLWEAQHVIRVLVADQHGGERGGLRRCTAAATKPCHLPQHALPGIHEQGAAI